MNTKKKLQKDGLPSSNPSLHDSFLSTQQPSTNSGSHASTTGQLAPDYVLPPYPVLHQHQLFLRHMQSAQYNIWNPMASPSQSTFSPLGQSTGNPALNARSSHVSPTNVNAALITSATSPVEVPVVAKILYDNDAKPVHSRGKAAAAKPAQSNPKPSANAGRQPDATRWTTEGFRCKSHINNQHIDSNHCCLSN